MVDLLEPTRLDAYVRGKAHDEQAPGIPQKFCDAMDVREQVFVIEQGVPLENEFDADDSRACHWITYASVNMNIEDEVVDAAGNIVKRRKRGPRSIPIGTLRLVPFPHEPHPQDGGEYRDGKLVSENGGKVTQPVAKSVLKEDGVVGAAEHVGEEPRVQPLKPVTPPDRATDLHNGKEPYVKLGRLAVLKGFRGNRIATLLIQTAMKWLKENPRYFNPSIREEGLENLGAKMPGEVPKWGGLVCVHAQKSVVELWKEFGFQVDEGMGTWWEEGIEHRGMFLRLDVNSFPGLIKSVQ
ncbi:hypothetical protein C8035_v011076 [Colletotrichum spinosum]|uniref:N-acetyltransferase domain-containing protein n=1 Tax=Colletotrichum spinosum TaxID=1347390 RepID=A0A4R8QC12_9PEZI|nr:hypothetical protein C8035_v011076 [Colletotrichum spinosum]